MADKGLSMIAKGASLPTRFALTGAVVAVAIVAGLGWIQLTLSTAQLKHSTEQSNAALTRTLGNVLQDRVLALLALAREVAPDQLGQRPEVAALNERIARSVRGTPVVKVKIYATSGLTVYSSDPKQIGEDKSANPGIQAALAGRIASDVTFRNKFDAFDGVIVDRDLVSSYIPVYRDGESRPYGIFEIYADVTALKGEISAAFLAGIGLLVIGLGVLYGLLLFTVVTGTRALLEKHRENLKLAASAARAESASRAKSEFLATMSHELRTPLNAIIGFSEIIERESFGPVGSDRYRSYAGDIRSSGTHLLEIINDVLDLAKAESGAMRMQPDEVELAPLLEAAAQMMRLQAERARIELVVEATGALPPVRADAQRLKQIVVNLLSNAIKFSPNGGRVALAAALEPRHDQVTIEVSDTGIGIAPDDIPIALAPFGQVESALNRRFEGTGLGLPLCKKFAELMGGSLRLESQPDVGTRVTVSLPAANGARQPAARAA